MDYPKSVPSIGLVGGKFVDEDPLAGTPGSLIPSAWGNSVTDEMLNVIQAAGLVPAEADLTQLLKAIRALGQAGATNYALDTGVANAYVAAFTPSITSRVNGRLLRFKAKTTNTASSTFNDGAGLANLVGLGGLALQGGEVVVDGICTVCWNSSLWGGAGAYVLLSCDTAPLQVAPALKSSHAVTLGQLQNRGSQLFASNGTFTVPAGITSVLVTLCGGGGGGAAYYDTTSAGGGGGGGAAGINIPISVTPGQVLAVTVGSAGTGGQAAAANGLAGAASSLGALVSAAGGGGGVAAGDGGSGGAASGSIVVAGSYGQAYNPSGPSQEQGGSGGGSVFGAGGVGSMRLGAVPARPGTGYGAGGGGGCRTVGASGSKGFVLVEWFQ
ncbi:glycine-rich domain-containing protein [Pseudomonas sp. GW460-12-10-14-LB1]|uniref:glycine-rich domain-containing protein n=1 Tax=Pseudomonas sp. GW460-12-10-14-LB1 TaxID=2751363 RepID=UPI001A9378C2|nr:hypothetical protein [Pseudomonas sp. GW460-12-10-14-LB1]